ncbi:MAG: tripartite tricarboxylate transporter substrate-binding protein [Xanthobacteraceae bacterium]
MTIDIGRRQFISALGGAVTWPLAAPALAANLWPTRPVTVICPFAPGISTDILARMVATVLGDGLGQNFIVENRPGANANIGAAAAAKAAPDGYTLLIATLGPIVTNRFMYKDMGYDPERAFSPIVLLAASPLIIVGSPKLPVTNLKELVVYARDNPGRLNAGTVGVGSQAHITLELINKLAGISIIHVPYRITTQALPDLISGDLQLGFNYIPTFVPAVQTGMIRGLAVTSLERLRDLPDVPTVDESGFPGFEASGWNALFAPAGTPRDVIDKVNTIVNAFLKSDTGRLQLGRIGMTAIGGTPEQLKAYLERETAKWGPIVKEANISLQ